MTRLKQGNVMELGMLRTLLKTAGGFSFADYSPTASLNETQLKGRSGSLTLTRETMSFGIVEETSARAADRVQAVLQANGLGVSLLILIAQARDQILFDATRGGFKEVKLFGNLYDSCQVVMSILLSFLTSDDFKDTKDGDVSSVASVSTFSECLPSLQELHEQYDLDFESVWFLCRPAVQAALTDNSGKHDKARSCRFELNEGVRHTYSNCLPERVWEFLNPQLVEFFHVNSSHDIYCPEELYRAEISRIQKEIERIKTAKPPPAKSEMDNLGRLQRVSQQLESDLMTQKHHVETTLKQLDEDKSSFFVLEDVSQEAARQFLMHCVYSRSIQGPDDAMYSSAFAFRLHNVWTPGFSIIHYLDELISVTAGALFGVTEGEAANLAILIWESWKVVNEWRYEEKIFDKQVLGKPGSQIEVLVEDERRSDPVSHKDFIELYNKWHSALGNALIGCLTSKEYMHMRTGLVVLTRLVDVFPTRPSVGNKLLKTLEPLQDESTSRPDIRASANAYGMLLLKARDDGKWVEEDEAVAKARAEKEKAAAEQRKKKLERTFQEIERDSEKITAEIGPKDRHDRDRGRDYTARDSGPTDASKGRHGVGRGDENSNSRSSDFARMESGELSGRGRNREDRDRRLAREEDDRGRERGGNSRDERRWQRDAPPRSAKRSRPSTPEMDRDVDRASSKRARLDPDNYSSRRSGSGGGGRGDASPLSRRTRRESPEQPPPRSRARRSRR
jgi:THO complex subunit 2